MTDEELEKNIEMLYLSIQRRQLLINKEGISLRDYKAAKINKHSIIKSVQYIIFL